MISAAAAAAASAASSLPEFAMARTVIGARRFVNGRLTASGPLPTLAGDDRCPGREPGLIGKPVQRVARHPGTAPATVNGASRITQALPAATAGDSGGKAMRTIREDLP